MLLSRDSAFMELPIEGIDYAIFKSRVDGGTVNYVFIPLAVIVNGPDNISRNYYGKLFSDVIISTFQGTCVIKKHRWLSDEGLFPVKSFETFLEYVKKYERFPMRESDLCYETAKTNDMPPRLYILMRLDIPDLNAGKAIAQGAHAADDAKAILSDTNSYKEWLKEAGTFGTTTVLEVTNKDIQQLNELSGGNQFGVVLDFTYPFRNVYGDLYTMPIVTCAWLFRDEYTTQEVLDYLSSLKLHR